MQLTMTKLAVNKIRPTKKSGDEFSGLEFLKNEIKPVPWATSYPGSYLRSPPRLHARCQKTLVAAGHVTLKNWGVFN